MLTAATLLVAAAAQPPLVQRCQVAQVLIGRTLARADRPVVFDIEPQDLGGGAPHRADWRWRNAQGPVPSASLLTAATRGGAPSAVVRCPAIRAFLRKRGIAFGAQAVGAVSSRKQGGLGSMVWDSEVAGVSLPVLSANGREAIAIASDYSGPLAGGGAALYLRLTPSAHWRVVSTATLYIS